MSGKKICSWVISFRIFGTSSKFWYWVWNFLTDFKTHWRKIKMCASNEILVQNALLRIFRRGYRWLLQKPNIWRFFFCLSVIFSPTLQKHHPLSKHQRLLNYQSLKSNLQIWYKPRDADFFGFRTFSVSHTQSHFKRVRFEFSFMGLKPMKKSQNVCFKSAFPG